jgi:hypothetical protein
MDGKSSSECPKGQLDYGNIAADEQQFHPFTIYGRVHNDYHQERRRATSNTTHAYLGGEKRET